MFGSFSHVRYMWAQMPYILYIIHIIFRKHWNAWKYFSKKSFEANLEWDEPPNCFCSFLLFIINNTSVKNTVITFFLKISFNHHYRHNHLPYLRLCLYLKECCDLGMLIVTVVKPVFLKKRMVFGKILLSRQRFTLPRTSCDRQRQRLQSQTLRQAPPPCVCPVSILTFRTSFTSIALIIINITIICVTKKQAMCLSSFDFNLQNAKFRRGQIIITFPSSLLWW